VVVETGCRPPRQTSKKGETDEALISTKNKPKGVKEEGHWGPCIKLLERVIGRQVGGEL